MNTTSCASEAAAAIASKAARLLAAAATGKKGADEKRRQAHALQRIAALVATGLDTLSARLGDEPDITDPDRRAAATEVYALATRRESRGSERQFNAPPKPGWEPGGDDFGLPIHRATLLAAVELHDIALALSYEEYWAYLKGLLLERLGDFDAAVRAFDSLDGAYAHHGAQQAARCRRKLGGSYDAESAMRSSFDAVIDKFDQQGTDSDPLRYVKDVLAQAVAATKNAWAEAPVAEVAADVPSSIDADPLELAATTAQQFAEHLADGDYRAAQAMLAHELASITADALQREFEQMIEYGAQDGESLEICVMSSDGDMPDMTPADLGWVYVAISGESFNEAVTVVVTREDGAPKIRELEWGRP